jgi:hypothetical protein
MIAVLKLKMDRLVGVRFARCFVMRGLKMQLLLWCTLIDLLGIFCMARVMYRECVFPWDRYRDLSAPSVKRKTSCIVRKGKKQIQILDGY